MKMTIRFATGSVLVVLAALTGTAQAQTTTRVSVSSAGVQGNFHSSDPTISGDGRFVAFMSESPEFAPGSTPGYSDIFVHDRQTGQTTRVSVSSAGVPGDFSSRQPSSTVNTPTVALESGDINGDGAVNVQDVFYLINYLFAGGPNPIGPGDVNGDTQVDGLDVFYLINYLFAGGPAPVTTLSPSGLVIPAGHPRLLFSTPALLAQARQWFSTTYGAGGFTLDGAIDYAFSYLMTGNTAHAQVAINWLMAIPHPGQDQMRWDGENAILVFDWCYDQLTPSQKATALANWTAYTLEANSWSWGGPNMPGSNYYWGYLRNGLLWGITSHGENTQADSLLNDAIVTRYRGTFLPFAASTLQGGVPAEGSQYGHYQLGYPITPFLTAGTLGVPLYSETPWYKEAVMYLVYAATNAPTPSHGAYPPTYHLWPYSDDQQWTVGSSLVHSDFGDFLQVAATRWPQGVGRYARHLLTLADLPRMSYLQALDTRVANDELDFNGLSLDYWAPGIKFLYARTGWDAQATSMMLQLAEVPGNSHEHQDYGSFQMWRAGQWMTRETVTYGEPVPGWKGVGQENGSRGYTHNVILFEGIGTNSQFYVGNDNYGDGPAQVSRMGRGADFAFAVTDLGKAYRSHLSDYIEDGTTRLRDDNAHVKGLVREFLWVRPLSTLVVFDRMESLAFDRQDAEASSGVTITPRVTDAALVHKTFLLHSEAPLNASPLPAAPTLSSYIATSGSSVMRCTTVLPASPTTQVIDEGTVLPADLAQFRLEVTTSGAAQSYFMHVIQARDAAASDVVPILTEDATTYTLTLTRGAATARIVFQKGMASTGGTFGYAATGSPTMAPLPTTVQSITVTDNGPVWGP